MVTAFEINVLGAARQISGDWLSAVQDMALSHEP
jgi:hypothetical protein